MNTLTEICRRGLCWQLEDGYDTSSTLRKHKFLRESDTWTSFTRSKSNPHPQSL
ncbi:hypothetical protein BDR06DRAFT_948780 [Suillus hirtellus]|nr:hypothetical protein BDR06DRAFT_948780 [Suillus hirtellus]